MGPVLMSKPYLVARELDTSVRGIPQRDRSCGLGKRNYADLEGKIMITTVSQ